MIFPDNKKRVWQCFVCGECQDNALAFKSHVIETHEEGREYLMCPVPLCGWPCRDLRAHFRKSHPSYKCPKDRQLRATIMYDVRSPSKRKRLPNFQSGFYVSAKNQGKQMHYRSSWEKQVYECLEQMGDVLRWAVEPFSIPYYYRGKQKQYYPDILVEFADGSKEIWEVKPANQFQLAQNKAKWAAAKHYCQLRGWNFEPITEQRIQQIKKQIQ